MKLSKAIQGYLLYARTKYAKATVDHYELTLNMIMQQIGDREVDSVTVEDLQNYFGWLRREYKPHRFLRPGQEPTVMSDAGVEGYWKAIRSFYKWAEKYIGAPRPDLAIPQPKYRMPEVKAFTPDEPKRLLYAAEWTSVVQTETKRAYRMHRSEYKRDVALLRFMLDTGLRVGEICRAKCEDVDLETGIVIVRPFGTGQKTKPRSVCLGKAARHAMWVYLANRDYKPDSSLF